MAEKNAARFKKVEISSPFREIQPYVTLLQPVVPAPELFAILGVHNLMSHSGSCYVN